MSQNNKLTKQQERAILSKALGMTVDEIAKEVDDDGAVMDSVLAVERDEPTAPDIKGMVNPEDIQIMLQVVLLGRLE